MPNHLQCMCADDTMKIGNNSLTGPIPSEMGRLSHLKALNVGTNRFSQSIPSEFGNIPGLQILALGTKLCVHKVITVCVELTLV